MSSATGTLIRKIARQVHAPISHPPISGPVMNEMPLHAVHVPIAAPRSPPENAAVRIASEAGVSSAPARPWSPRKTISVVEVGAAAQSADATPKLATPIMNTRTSPKMSPSEPPTRMNDPSVSRYASTIHCCAASPPPRSAWIDGSATLTTVESTNTIDVPRIVATIVKRAARRESPPGAATAEASTVRSYAEVGSRPHGGSGAEPMAPDRPDGTIEA